MECLPHNNTSAGITYTQPVEQKIRKCSVSLGFNSWKEISNLRIPKDDMQVILGKYPNTPITNKSLIILNDLKQSMCHKFRNRCHVGSTDSVVVGDMPVKMATEGSDINRKTSPDSMSKGEQFIVIESDSDVEICETILATQSIPPTSCLELAYMKGNGDISPDISESNAVPECTLKDDLLLDSEDASSIAALIFVMEKYKYWHNVVS